MKTSVTCRVSGTTEHPWLAPAPFPGHAAPSDTVGVSTIYGCPPPQPRLLSEEAKPSSVTCLQPPCLRLCVCVHCRSQNTCLCLPSCSHPRACLPCPLKPRKAASVCTSRGSAWQFACGSWPAGPCTWPGASANFFWLLPISAMPWAGPWPPGNPHGPPILRTTNYCTEEQTWLPTDHSASEVFPHGATVMCCSLLHLSRHRTCVDALVDPISPQMCTPLSWFLLCRALEALGSPESEGKHCWAAILPCGITNNSPSSPGFLAHSPFLSLSIFSWCFPCSCP